MAIKSMRYSGRAIASAGMGLNHSNNYASRDKRGVTVPVNTPMFDTSAAFGSAPTTVAVVASQNGVSGGGGRQCQVLGSGIWSDETPVIFSFSSSGTSSATPGANTGNCLRIGIGSNWTAGELNATTTPTAGLLANTVGKRVACFDIGCKAGDLGGGNKGGQNLSDILRGTGAGNGETANTIHSPGVCFAAYGLLVAWCAVVKYQALTGGGNGWVTTASSLCQYDDSAATWKLVNQLADSAATDQGALAAQRPRPRGSVWNNLYWTAEDKTVENPLVLWAVFVDYVSGSRAGVDDHVAMLMRATRPSATSSNWTVTASEVFRIADTSGNQHLHSAIITPVGIVISQGHTGASSVILLRWTTPWSWNNGTNTGAASSTDGATQNGWTTDLNYSGFRSGVQANIRYNNQYMNVCPLNRTHTDFLVSTDIGLDAMSQMYLPPAATSKPVFSPIRAGRGCADNTSVQLEVFSVSTGNNHKPGPFVSLKAGQASGNALSAAAGVFAGSNWGNNVDIQKIIYSRDGINWAQLYSRSYAGIVREPRLVGEQVFATVLSDIDTYQIVAVTLPPISVGRPLVVAASNTNYAINPVQIVTAPGAGNTLTDVTATYQNANAVSNGFTIPPCPSPNQVFRLDTTGTSNTGPVLGFTTNDNNVTNTCTVPQVRPILKVWVYIPPVSSPFVNHATAPFDSQQPQLSINGFKRSAGGLGDITANPGLSWKLETTQGGGWVCYHLPAYPDADSRWTDAAISRYLLILQTNSSGTPIVGTILFSIESFVAGNVNATSASRLTEMALKPLPCSVNNGAISVFSDLVETAGFYCGSSWSIALALQVPDDGPDQYNYAVRPSGRRLAHLVQSRGTNAQGVNQNRYISVEYDPTIKSIRFTDTNSNSTVLAAPAGQNFEYGRDTQIGIAVSCTPASASTSSMVFAVFMGGTLVNTTGVTWTGAVNPSKVVHADESISPVEPHLVHAVYCNDAVALNASQLTALLQSGGALQPPFAGTSSFSTIIFDD